MGPSVDTAAQAADIFESVAKKIGRRVETVFSLVIDNDEDLISRPACHDFLHRWLRKEQRAFNPDGLVFFAGADVQ